MPQGTFMRTEINENLKTRMNTLNKFRLDGKVAVVTGGAGLLGKKHAEVIAESGGIPVLWDINEKTVDACARDISQSFRTTCLGMKVNITDPESIQSAFNILLKKFNGEVDILINNAANDPKTSTSGSSPGGRLESFTLDAWQKDVAVGLTGAFLCSQVIGTYMAQEKKGGVILNIASDLGLIAPDQRIYRKDGLKDDEQPVKPITYSVIKHGIVGLTKYLATYWADKKIRVNCLSPGGVYTDQSEEFVQKLTKLIPVGHMANQDDYKAAVLFLVSPASEYMTGANLVIDGGRTCW